MTYIFNLSAPEKSTTPIKIIRFPDGHVHLDLSTVNLHDVEEIQIKMRITNGDDLFLLAQLMNFIRKRKSTDIRIYLTIGYLLAGRYDREMHERDTFDLKIICDQINSYNFYRVIVYQPHSVATTSLINNCKAFCPLDAPVAKTLKENPKIVIIAPDLGSVKRLDGFMIDQKLENQMLILNKHRDIKTGKILGIQPINAVDENLIDKGHALIYDDLCDGGATFLFAAKALREMGFLTVDLVITHSIFSAGTDKLLTPNAEGMYLNNILTMNTYKDHEPRQNLTVIRYEL